MDGYGKIVMPRYHGSGHLHETDYTLDFSQECYADCLPLFWGRNHKIIHTANLTPRIIDLSRL